MRLSVFTNPSARETLADQPWADSVELVTHPLVGRQFTRAVSELTVLGSLADRRGVDVLHSLAMIAPLRMRAVSVVTRSRPHLVASPCLAVAPDVFALAHDRAVRRAPSGAGSDDLERLAG